MKGHFQTHPSYKWLWKSCCQSKRKIFSWVLLKNRFNTRALFKRRNMFLDDYNCAVCTWWRYWRTSGGPLPPQQLCLSMLVFTELMQWSELIKPIANFGNLQRKSTSTIFHGDNHFIMCWSIWVSSNALIFYSRTPSVQSSVEFFKHNIAMVIHRAKSRNAPVMSIWLENFSNSESFVTFDNLLKGLIYSVP